MSIVSAALITKLADFGVKVCMKLAVKWHKGPSHDRAEKYREILKEIENEKAKSAGVDSVR